MTSKVIGAHVLLQVLVQLDRGMLLRSSARGPILVVLEIFRLLGDRLLKRAAVRLGVHLGHLVSSGHQIAVHLTVRGGYSVVDALMLEPMPAPLHRFLQLDRRGRSHLHKVQSVPKWAYSLLRRVDVWQVHVRLLLIQGAALVGTPFACGGSGARSAGQLLGRGRATRALKTLRELLLSLAFQNVGKLCVLDHL